MLSRALLVLLLAASFLVGSAAAATHPTQQMDILAGYKVSYADADGKPMSVDAFRAAAKDHQFSIAKDLKKHTAVLRLMSQAEIDEMKTRIAHPALSPLVGKAFPAFDAPSVDGRKRSLADYRGKIVLVNFFFATCLPCIQEVPTLNAFKKAHPDIRVLAVTFDDRQTASEFVKGRGFSWPVIYDEKSLADKAKVHAYPTMVLIGPDGIVRKADISATIGRPDDALTLAKLSAWAGVSN